MIKFQQSQALTSHFESFCSIVYKQLTDLSPSFPGWRPAATMYVLPMVLIFSKTLNFGLERS